MARMSDTTLKGVLAARITASLGSKSDPLTKERIAAEKYYRGEKFGNEEEGRSQVVSRDVAEAIDSMMPSLMKIFTAGDEVVRFDPRNANDEEAAAQATEYVNYIWSVENDGFGNFYTWFKSALMKKRGIIKIWWDKRVDVSTEHYHGLTQQEVDILNSDEDVEIAELTVSGLDVDESGQLAQYFDVKVRRSKETGTVCVSPVPPDEFIIDPRAIDDETTPFIGDRQKRTVSDLVADGYDKRLVESLGAGDAGDLTQERTERFSPESSDLYDDDSDLDPTMRKVWVTECYIRVDYDGDGIAEMRKITCAGEGSMLEILDNEEVPDHPYATLCPLPLPHKFWGQSIADVTMDVQLVKSTILRQILDNLYLTNKPQIGAVEGQVNLDDLLNRRAGGVIRMKSPTAIVPIVTTPLGAEPYNMLTMWDGIRETRTGVRRFSTGPNANSLDDAYSNTATGANIVAESSAERLEMIARIFAETGVRRAMKMILRLVSEYQQEPRMIKLRDKWVPMDPREWNNGMDMTVTVGLGTGNKQSQIQAIMALLNLDQTIVQLQQGVNGPLLTTENIYAKLRELVSASGLKGVEKYYTDPSTAQQQQQPPKPDPKMVEMQAKLQLEQQKAQADQQMQQQKMQMDAESNAADMQMKQANMQAELQIKREQLGAEMELKREQLAAELILKREQMQAEMELKARLGVVTAAQNANTTSGVHMGGEPG